jgi:hypothetical protein
MEFAQHKVDMPRGATVAMASTGSDQNLYVEFYLAPSQYPDPILSEEAGFPIHSDVPWVKIMVPGDRTKQWDRPAKLSMDGDADTVPPDNVRFRQQWQAFQENTRAPVTGLAIEQWAAITKSESDAFKSMQIHTVEQLSALPDSSLTWLGGRHRRDQAIAWLNSAKDHAGEAKLAKENEQMRAQIDALTLQVKELAALAGKDIEPAQAKRMGRPPKVREN